MFELKTQGISSCNVMYYKNMYIVKIDISIQVRIISVLQRFGGNKQQTDICACEQFYLPFACITSWIFILSATVKLCRWEDTMNQIYVNKKLRAWSQNLHKTRGNQYLFTYFFVLERTASDIVRRMPVDCLNVQYFYCMRIKYRSLHGSHINS